MCDAVVNKEDIFAAEFSCGGVELATNACPAQFLCWRNECTENISVFYEAVYQLFA